MKIDQLKHHRLWQYWYLLFPILSLFIFINKPFQLDDAVFLNIGDRLPWTWFGAQPVTTAFNGTYFENLSPYESTHPPLIPYLLKCIGVFSPSSTPRFFIYHLFFFAFPLLSVLWGIKLSRLLNLSPIWLAFLFLTPAYFVNATSLMTDVALVSFLMGGLFFAIRLDMFGRPRDGVWFSIQVLLASLTAYQALVLPILITTIWLIQKRWKRVIWPIIPITIFFSYLLVIYGTSGFFPFLAHTAEHNIEGLLAQGRESSLMARKVMAVCIHMGFALLPAAPWLFSRIGPRLLVGLSLSTTIWTLVFVEAFINAPWMWYYSAGKLFFLKALFALGSFWIFYAVSQCFITFSGLFKNQVAMCKPLCLLMFLAVVGYNLFLMPYVNTRYILPALPAMLLFLGMITRLSFHNWPQRLWFITILALSLICARVDYQRATMDHQIAQNLVQQLKDPRDLWYCDDHGLGRYLTQAGARYYAHDMYRPQPGNYVLSCRHLNNRPDNMRLVQIFSQRAFAGLALHQPNAGAGFYASMDGLLPLSLNTQLHTLELWQVVY